MLRAPANVHTPRRPALAFPARYELHSPLAVTNGGSPPQNLPYRQVTVRETSLPRLSKW